MSSRQRPLLLGVVLTFALCFHFWAILSIGDIRRVCGRKPCYHHFILPRTTERTLGLQPAECVRGSWLYRAVDPCILGRKLGKVETFARGGILERRQVGTEARLGSRRPHCCGTWKRTWVSDHQELGNDTGVGLVLGWPLWGVKFLCKWTFPCPQDLVGLSGFRLEKHLFGCKLSVATSYFPLLQPGQA